MQYTGPGACVEGVCVFAETPSTCPHGCADAACVDLCAGNACADPPAGTCDGGVLIGFEATGTCDANTGECEYRQQIVDCAADEQICDATLERPACADPPPTCEDGARNGEETDVDCGGEVCLGCGEGLRCRSGTDCESSVCTTRRCAAATCNDRTQNGDETGLDCGGEEIGRAHV